MLPGGWTVGSRHERKPNEARFSLSYTVHHNEGRQGFLKVLDLVGVFGDLHSLNRAVGDYIAERDLLMLCGEASMSRVVIAIDHGQVTLPGYLPPLATVHYIVFEHADGGNLNEALSQVRADDIGIRLDLIHDYAVGLRQLHQLGVAHQDIKPANSLVFSNASAAGAIGKLGDLGRAFRPGVATSHDSTLVPGDRSFAPPEQLYGYEHPDIGTRRYAADLYQLGSMICYAFGAMTMNALLAHHLAPEHLWGNFGDGYLAALPYLQEAYSAALIDLSETLPPSIAEETLRIVTYLCEPEADRRGHPRASAGHGSRFSLERVVAELNLAAVRARVRLAAIV